MSAELQARRTAAAAVLADYDRAMAEYGGHNPNWIYLAQRLAPEMRSLLDQLAVGESAAANGHVTRISRPLAAITSTYRHLQSRYGTRGSRP